ncbi:hypothetical protein PSECIP111854_03396 [Pseudoalteromonas sp. CIP111854]|uniref:Competence protein CoiA n=1 Tax=Pseudoalteromonas holothuriae TaxID=2963714 RepID=A0A9W4W2B0_9GAMM|nr:hypothetical protein [Pseudoalteromonas sp. CIP111854]CAH9064224.1 hypothetical protein PSECIP111854_03396 [Pseudoalteromonas sp. CIP111854]
MLIFAHNKLGKLVSINDVPNGKLCQCTCPGCDDELVARNRGKIKAHSFAHTSKPEKSSCLMTALHRFAQEYLAAQEQILLPSVKYKHMGKTKVRPPKLVKILQGSVESPLDKYKMDVELETSVGKIFIEVKVTANCSDEKVSYIKSNKVATLEIDLSQFLEQSIEAVIDALRNVEPYSTWIYSWCDEALKNEIEKEIEAERVAAQQALEREIKRKKTTAKRAINNLIRSGTIGLPAKELPFTTLIEAKKYQLQAKVLNAGSWSFNNFQVMIDTEDYILATCQMLSKKGKEANKLFIFFPYSAEALRDFKPIPNSAVLCRLFRKGSYPYKWLSFPEPSPHKLKKAQDKAEQAKRESLEYFENYSL